MVRETRLAGALGSSASPSWTPLPMRMGARFDEACDMALRELRPLPVFSSILKLEFDAVLICRLSSTFSV